ncbi:succinate dehydrogenase cytochrome b subunit [Leptolyngbya cf. ectocarpi LEGE 11479]|uniref:Succinate dehydrogenase cytochrome b subunit n=1 Tax=Leptolyngbya cf. ectocarpi LEGE 11479 TaxID=1828722 RepID=A0A928ZT49_LEPEC|nr:succinate dehydrogenase cytochrome b subunit [Leptolyngbya ectocarpi]MBE9066386.1 succinate dehydrogenase cytochrome b subunit [Leptolyngbya cf. ectocarpi LEGE 11479]
MTAAPAPNRVIRLYQSSVGKKLITGISGLALVAFVMIHMTGNLILLASADGYNQFGYVTERLGPLFWLIELVLLGFIGLHILMGVQIFLGRLRARPQGYSTYTSAGPPSYQTLSSRTMIVTGVVLGSFLVWHLLTFKFGTRYTVPDSEVRDLARLVIEKFQQPLYAFGYVGIMVLLASHLRHGIWSALQSLGALNATVRPVAYGVSLVLAIGIALGFVVLPLGIYVGLVT